MTFRDSGVGAIEKRRIAKRLRSLSVTERIKGSDVQALLSDEKGLAESDLAAELVVIGKLGWLGAPHRARLKEIALRIEADEVDLGVVNAVRQLRALAATPVITREMVFEVLGELGFEWGGAAADVIKNVEAGNGDATKVAIRILARAIEAGQITVTGEQGVAAEEPPAAEPEVVKKPAPLRQHAKIVNFTDPGRRVPPDDEPDFSDTRGGLPEAEELLDEELLRALADNLADSKHPLHRAAVARLFSIADRLESIDARRENYDLEMQKRLGDLETSAAAYADTAERLWVCQQDVEKLEARIDVLEKKAHEPFDFAALVKRLDRLEEIAPHGGPVLVARVTEVEERANRLESYPPLIAELETKLQSQIDSVTEYTVPGIEEKISQMLSQIAELNGRTLTEDEVTAIRAGLAEG